MSPEAVHAILADLERNATRVTIRQDGRETWRFRIDDGGTTYDLHFYPDDGRSALERKIGGGPAAREFAQLQSLQTLAIPATRVVANLKGFRLGDRKGDACIVVHDPTIVGLDELLRTNWPPPAHRERLERIASLVAHLEALGRTNMTPVSLRPERFGVRGQTMVLTDGEAMLSGKADAARVAEFDSATRHLSSVADRLRLWRALFRDAKPPRSDRPWRQRLRELVTSNDIGSGAFHEIEYDGWTGRALRQSPFLVPWSEASAAPISHDDWLKVIPGLLDPAGGSPIKFDESSLVTTQTTRLGNRSIQVVSKRPAFKPGMRGNLQRYRRSRVVRAWTKTWRLLAIGLPVEVPLLVLERRRGWRLVEQLYVVERVPGPTMEAADLDAMPERERTRLMHAAGRTLRLLERNGFRHGDAKSANWIAWTSHAGQTRPIMLDLDATRTYGRRGEGAARLARSLKAHPQITEFDLATLAAAFSWPR